MFSDIRLLPVLAIAAMLAIPATSMSSELDVNKLLKDLEGQLEVSKDRLEELEPELRAALEKKSSELSSSMSSALDEGLTELGKLGAQYEAASAEASDKLRELLESNEVAELKEFLSSLDEDAVRQARDKLVAELTDALKLTAEQIAAIKPLLSEKLEKLGEILKQYLDKGKADVEQFRVEFEAESKKDIDEFKAILDSDQVEQLKKQLESFKQSFQTEVLEA